MKFSVKEPNNPVRVTPFYFFLLCFGLLSPLHGFAFTPDDFLEKIKALSFTCRTPQDLAQSIYYCSENDEAVDSAESCRAALKQLWDQAPKELNQVYSVARKEIIQRQEKKFDDTQSDYKKAMAKLDQLITATKKNADLVAQYPRAMVDVPGVDWDPSRSAPCYNDRFNEVQKIVSKLDDMIIEGEMARAKSAQLRGVALDSDQKIDSGKGVRVIKTKLQTVTPGFSVDHRYRDSDVTGLKEEKPLNTESTTSTKQLPLKRMKDEPNSLLIDDILQNRSTP